MITQEPYFKVTCDVCGEGFPDESGGQTLYETEQEARAEVAYSDGEIAADGKATCPACVEERPRQPEGEER